MKLTEEQFQLAKQFIADSNIKAQLEVRMFNVWGAGSRPVIYSALTKETFKECSLTEKVLLNEAFEMMAEQVEPSESAAFSLG